MVGQDQGHIKTRIIAGVLFLVFISLLLILITVQSTLIPTPALSPTLTAEAKTTEEAMAAMQVTALAASS